MEPLEPENRPRAARAVDRVLGAQPALDGLADVLRPLARRLRGRGAWRALVTGEAMGHAAHPFLTDLPIGFWTSAALLDLVPGTATDDAARRLVGAGLVAAPAAALTGFAEYAALPTRPRRVAVVHAATNVTALGLYAASWAVRPRRRTAGRALGLAGLAVSGASAYLGGHLALVEKVGTPMSRSEEVDPADRRGQVTA